MEPNTIQEAQDLDSILQYFIDKRSNAPDARNVHEDLFASKPFEYVHNLCFIIERHVPQLVIARVYTPAPGNPADSFYYSNSYTASFLHSGGFLARFNEIHRLRIIEEESRRLSMEKLRFEAKMTKWKYKTYWIAVGAGIIGFLLSIYNTFASK